MRIKLCAIGKAKSGPESALVADYLDRADKTGRGLGFRGVSLQELEAPRAARAAARKAAETEALLSANSAAARIIALDLGGECWSSEKMAKTLARWRDDGAAETAFLIGGADGFDAAVADRADVVLAFGRATWPHLLARVMTAEQIYRAMTILTGLPYHRRGRP